jgi:hypothetical protein
MLPTSSSSSSAAAGNGSWLPWTMSWGGGGASPSKAAMAVAAGAGGSGSGNGQQPGYLSLQRPTGSLLFPRPGPSSNNRRVMTPAGSYARTPAGRGPGDAASPMWARMAAAVLEDAREGGSGEA